MKKSLAGGCAVLLLCCSLPALADNWRGDRHGHHRNQHRPHHQHFESRTWVLPGLAIGAGIIATRVFQPPPVIVAPVAPMVMAPPPAQTWYFCDHYQAYHPYVQSCPSGWRPVPSY